MESIQEKLSMLRIDESVGYWDSNKIHFWKVRKLDRGAAEVGTTIGNIECVLLVNHGEGWLDGIVC